MLFPTALVGSYPQPEWLIDRKRLAERFPPRVRARELWRIPEPWLADAQNDATLLAIRAQELAGLDVITDGEIRRESYSNRFATALEASMSTIPARHSIAAGIRIRCRESWAESGAGTRWRSMTSNSCVDIRTGW